MQTYSRETFTASTYSFTPGVVFTTLLMHDVSGNSRHVTSLAV